MDRNVRLREDTLALLEKIVEKRLPEKVKGNVSTSKTGIVAEAIYALAEKELDNVGNIFLG